MTSAPEPRRKSANSSCTREMELFRPTCVSPAMSARAFGGAIALTPTGSASVRLEMSAVLDAEFGGGVAAGNGLVIFLSRIYFAGLACVDKN